ncbi:MAG TPA: sigma-54 dependent transcriptional regulator [Thermodesulfobacteriota bacterium]|nr:sigma-54-dependent Fis family transcriptional regulator [Deltaproteobacteria bacterium]HNR12578.1 sigma-54 dependent transcriptional regulator [Thermodesulfobacteriota bacterium]HNU72691.1 sigma-54 dependent transcriptional regulator [Thermodesulfobacteriota bacterium]
METPCARVLVIDDERSVCVSCAKILKDKGYEVDYVLSGVEGVKKAIEDAYEIVLLDLRLKDLAGMEILERIQESRPDITVIIITGYATIQTTIEAVKKGAFDYIPKPFTPEELSFSLSKAMKDRELRSENEYLKQQLSQHQLVFSEIISRSEAMNDVLKQILKIAPTEFSVLIYGESGTGKELISQAIHRNSLRSGKPLIAVDISALPATLIESELFGHVKGAFTGAISNKPGYFSLAHRSTLFIDEISNISKELQGILLRVLETKRLRPVGGEKEQEVDIRLIAATNKDLYKLVEAGEFREDLYYRLNVIPIKIPPLRERTADIPPLVTHFLERAKEKTDSRVRGFTTEAMAKLFSYQWPGNVRELKNIVERLVATVDAESIGVSHLPSNITGSNRLARDLGIQQIPGNVEELKVAKMSIKERAYQQVESSFILEALQKCNWNISSAAKLVGMQRSNFHALMRKYAIKK